MEETKILVVDDEVANLQKLRRTFINRYPVLAASSGKDALAYVEKDSGIAVIVADQRMPDMTGVEFLRHTLEPLPHAVRILLTGFTDMDVLMDAINSCKVFRYMVKPWDPPDLLMTVERGLESYRLAAENERFRRELIRRELLSRELEIAREIQRYILPSACPAPEGYEMAVEYHPAREVGGDLYDFDWDPARGILQIVIGDVSGKSIPAALYGAVFSGQMQAFIGRSESPSQTLQSLNSTLTPRYQASNYIAVAHLRLDLASGRGRIANGGMPYPFLVRDGEITRIQVSGVPLGLLPESIYDEASFEMRKGDLLVLASDGIADAMNPQGKMFDEERLVDAIQQHAAEPIKECVQHIYSRITEFTQTAEVHDDITILGLRRRE